MYQPCEKNRVCFSTQLIANDFMRMAYAFFVFCYGLSTVHHYGKENPYKLSYGAWDALSLYSLQLGELCFFVQRVMPVDGMLVSTGWAKYVVSFWLNCVRGFFLV